MIDAMLVATAQRRRRHIVTRNNVRDVRLLGAEAFNPWTDDPADFPLQA